MFFFCIWTLFGVLNIYIYFLMFNKRRHVVEGLASSGVSQTVLMKGQEIKHLMSLLSIPDECQHLDGNQRAIIAYISINHRPPAKIYCTNNQLLYGFKTVNRTLMFLLSNNLLYKSQYIDHRWKDIGVVEDNEVFDNVMNIYYEGILNLVVSNDKIQHVRFQDLSTIVNTKVLENIHTLCLRICKTVPTSSNPSLYVGATYRSIKMSVDCKMRTVRLVDEDRDTINAFTGSGSVGIPLIYSWKSKEFISDVSTLPTDWVQIKYSKHYTRRPSRDPIGVKYSNEQFPLSQLKEDFGALWKRLSLSSNKKGVVILGDKVIANLRKTSETRSGRKTSGLMKVEGIFDCPDPLIFFHDRYFYNGNGEILEPSVHIEHVQPISRQDPIVEEYVDLDTFREVFRSQTHNIENSFDKHKKNVRVEFVYKDRSFWTATFINDGTIAIYLIDNLQVLTVDNVNGKRVVKKRVYDLVYFLPHYADGAFISPDIPLLNILAVRLTHYEPQQHPELLENVQGLITKSCTRANSKPVLYFESPRQFVRMSVDCSERKATVPDEDSQAFNIFPTSQSGHPSKTYVFDNDQTPLRLVKHSPDYTWVLRKTNNYAESAGTLLISDIENKLFISLYDLKEDLGDLYKHMSGLLKVIHTTGAVILGDKMIVSLTKTLAFPSDPWMEVGGEIETEGDNKIFFDTNAFVGEIDDPSPDNYVKLTQLTAGISIVAEYIHLETFRRIIRSQSVNIRNAVKGKKYPLVIVDYVHNGRASLTAIYTSNGIEKYLIKNMRVLTTNTNDDKIFATKTEHRVVSFLPDKDGGAFVTHDKSLHAVLAVRLPRYEPTKADYLTYGIIQKINIENEFTDWQVILRVKLDTRSEKI